MHAPLALATLAALLLFLIMIVRVGGARGRFGVDAPATTGHPEFERHFRVQANTLEGLVLFLPAVWLFSLALDHILRSDRGDLIGAGLTAVWIVGRTLYMISYVRDPASRGPGFGIQALAALTALFGGIGAVIWIMAAPGG